MPPTFCNPLSLPDVESCLPFSGKCRACGEPSLIEADGTYFLYPSHNGVFTSRDFVSWEAHPLEFLTGSLPQPDAGPHHVCKVGDRYLLTANNVICDNTASPLYGSDSPLGPWRALGQMRVPDGRLLKDRKGPLNVMEFFDAKLLYDDDRRLYVFWGCSATGGIWGAELAPDDPVQLLTEPELLFRFDPAHRWKCCGVNNENFRIGWVEGCFPFKHGGTYYLLYSAAGVGYPSYATGYYTAKAPLGPYTYASGSPAATALCGMAPGGGHASLFAGANDSLWLLYTVVYAGSYQYERLTGVVPAWFDEGGALHTACGIDVPQYVPGVLHAPKEENAAGLIRVNLLKSCSASSSAPGCMPLLAAEGTPRSWWQPAAGDEEPLWEEDLLGAFSVSAFRIVWKYPGYDATAGVVTKGPVRYLVEYLSAPGAPWQTLFDASREDRDLWIDYRTFPEVTAVRIRVRLLSWTGETGIGIVDFALFGRCQE